MRAQGLLVKIGTGASAGEVVRADGTPGRWGGRWTPAGVEHQPLAGGLGDSEGTEKRESMAREGQEGIGGMDLLDAGVCGGWGEV